MTSECDVFYRTAGRALSGDNAHPETGTILDGLDWKLAGTKPAGAPHSLFQLVNHMIYWQEWVVKWLDGKKPRPPKHTAGGWPGRVSPANRREWEGTLRRHRSALDELNKRLRAADPFSKRGKMTRLEMLHIIGSHNSYHAGQVAFLRRQLGAWPPASGGITW